MSIGFAIPTPFTDMATGTFTVENDMTSESMTIAHGLNGIPKIIIVYLDGTSARQGQFVQGLRVNGGETIVVDESKKSFRNMSMNVSSAGYTGADLNNYRGITAAGGATFKITAHSTLKLFAGDTYRWIAII